MLHKSVYVTWHLSFLYPLLSFFSFSPSPSIYQLTSASPSSRALTAYLFLFSQTTSSNVLNAHQDHLHLFHIWLYIPTSASYTHVFLHPLPLMHYSLGLFPVITSKNMFQSHNNFWQHKKPHGGLLCCGQRPHRTAAHIDRAIWFNDQGTYSRNKPVTICYSQILYCEISHTSNWRQFTTSPNVYAHIIVRGHVPVYICVCLWVCLGQRGC